MEKGDIVINLDNATLNNLDKEDPKFTSLCNNIKISIQNRTFTIIELIQQLGCLLTDQSHLKREVGVLILAEVVQNLDTSFLSSEQLMVLSKYLVEKLKDHHQVVPAALKGLLGCIKCQNLASESVVQILSAIFTYVPCQQQQQCDRYNIFYILMVALKKFPKEVQSLSYDFVYGVISAIDGERDPKNLKFIFSWMPTCLKTVKLGHLSEEMFEVLACYFPVDFKAPPSDPSKITREELADALCSCLTAISDFGESCLPLALEKFESNHKIAKEDSLNILKAGCEVYETRAYLTHSVEIWSQLQREIFNTNDENLRIQCLDTFTAIVKTLSEDPGDSFVSFVFNIADTLKGNLVPNQKLFFPSSSILIAVSRASTRSSILVTNRILPLLQNTFRITSNSKHKEVILSVCVELTVSIVKFNVYSSENFNVPLICLQAIMDKNSDLRSGGYKGLSKIAKILSETERKVLYENFIKSILFENDPVVRPFTLKCLNSLALIYPEEIKRHVIENQRTENLNELENYLETLCVLSSQEPFEAYVVDQLINYAVTDITYTPMAIKNINKIVGISEVLNNLFLEKNFLDKIIHFLLSSNQRFEVTFLDNFSLVLNKLIRLLPSVKQQEIFSEQFRKGIQDNAISIAIFKGLIIPLKPEAVKYCPDIVVDKLLELTLGSHDDFVKDTSVKILANIVNKMENGPNLDEKLNRIKMSYNSNAHIRHDMLTWIAKALVMKNHPKSLNWVDEILKFVELDKECSIGLKIVLNDNYEELSRINHCQVMPLYKQKLFVYCTNKIVEKYEPQKSNYLIAVGCLIEFAPTQAVAAQFKKILKLIIHCLEKCDDPNVLVNLLHRIQEFVEQKEKSIEDNLEDILLRVLDLTTFEASMKVRMAAIHCLSKFAQSYEVYKLLPLQDKVINRLGKCVDDKKRLVRKEAMDARSVWYLLDSPM